MNLSGMTTAAMDNSMEAASIGPQVADAFRQGRYLRIRNWSSRFLSAERDLFVYLPEAYHLEPQRHFPVLILHDGQNLFDGDLSYVKGQTWRVGETADEEIRAQRVQPLILVGVANTGVARMAEYTPTADGHLGGGKGPLYARLLVDDLLPELQNRLRVLSGPENVGIAGSSLGGLISLSVAMRFPDSFGKVGVLSPSIWWDHRAILRDVRALKSKLPLKLWLDMGTAEGLRHVRDANLLAQLLQAKGWQPGEDLCYRRYPGGVHTESAWAARFADVLRFLFPA